MTLKYRKTQRGFALIDFEDHNGKECSLQKSSVATEECVWFGCDDIGLKRFDPKNGGWKDIELEQESYGICHVANNRMHLSQEQVKELLPALQYFAEHGELPDEEI